MSAQSLHRLQSFVVRVPLLVELRLMEECEKLRRRCVYDGGRLEDIVGDTLYGARNYRYDLVLFLDSPLVRVHGELSQHAA